jgi:hypothetical protein
VAVIRTDDEAGFFDAFFRHLVGVDEKMDCRGGKRLRSMRCEWQYGCRSCNFSGDQEGRSDDLCAMDWA